MSKLTPEKQQFLKKLGERIASHRERKELSQADLGHLIDWERQHVSRLELGESNPTALTLRKICRALEITLEELFRDLPE
jgi:transcriptional regulator with XRE-family HTH domain